MGNSWEQTWHSDEDTIEDVRLQLSLQNYSLGDGPTEFKVGTHLFPKRFFTGFGPPLDLFPMVRRVPVAAGDAVLYFPSTWHRGTSNVDRKIHRRIALDFALQSQGRFYHRSDRDTRPGRPEFVDFWRKAVEKVKGPP